MISKKNTLFIGIIAAFILLVTSARIVMGSTDDNTKKDALRKNNPYFTGKHRKNENPDYKANKDKNPKELLSKKEILALVEKFQRKTDKSKIRSITLKTYKESILEDDPSDYSYNLSVDEDRMVWVVITEYQDGLKTRVADYEYCTILVVLDAETGDFLKSTAIEGKLIGKMRAPGQ